MLGATSEGSIGIEPWQIPRMGGGTTQGGKSWATTPRAGESPQNIWEETGMSGGFASGNWAAKLPPAEHRGIFGGAWGTRTGGGA